MKKIEGYAAELMKDIIYDGESVLEIEGKRYHITFFEEPETTVNEDIETDPELKGKLIQAKREIKDGHVFSTVDVLKMIDRGEI
ncbi:hypothetical protein QNH23_13315 [Siminovitchia fortis]|uniref:Uncharacterized protein n=1 Tax=Siminovitchia fortis TaxID=254758 RepID=A0A443IQP3_9BACI|nr:hypothetical protein [Siminovitchia fortis]RWR09276.1 hypothetical protein D4N35_010725 [Siminovitchia fortis]WHY80887.1 hypothetical protein QNH23_13315 [Siminovitchia fortis]